MAKFRFSSVDNINFNTPQEMFDDYKNRNITAIYDYQSKMIDLYLERAMSAPDVAMELPTGTGKTLVGLLIGEFRRRKNLDKVVYLCPNKQLVHQTVQHANDDYGINAWAFTGKVKDFTPEQKAQYKTAKCIAVTTYSSLFNSNPFFDDADLLIFDDAHSGESYVASNWTVAITQKDYKDLYFELIDTLKLALDSEAYERLLNGRQNYSDLFWIDKVPNIKLVDCYSEIRDKIEQYLVKNQEAKIKYPWSMISGHLRACNIFISVSEIVIRPFIPPTQHFEPFTSAKQRLYMSATLGKSGELERAFGVAEIKKLPMVKDWENRTIGRRFFMFPLASFPEDKVLDILLSMMNKVNRSLLIVNNDKTQKTLTDFIEKNTKKTVYSARDIEETKQSFINDDNAVAIVANRFDGIDFPDDECRLEILFDLQTATHIQEKFLTTCMGSRVLFTERIKARLVQGFGRCTRSHTDYAAVCILGEDLSDAVISPKKLAQYNPELQAELQFGYDNSIDQESIEEYLELLDVFLYKRKQWNEVEQEIISRRDGIIHNGVQVDEIPYTQLSKASKLEIEAQYSLWREDYYSAIESCGKVIDILKHESLKGYQGFWCYIAAYCAFNLFKQGNGQYKSIYRDYIVKASKTTLSITWFNRLFDESDCGNEAQEIDCVIERIENKISRMKFKHSHQKGAYEQLDDLLQSLEESTGEDFESFHCELGEWLGYTTTNPRGDSEPDPIWIRDRNLCIVFEDKIYESDDKAIPTKHVRQAAGHHNWVMDKANDLDISNKAKCITVFLTNSSFIEKSAAIQGKDVFYLHKDELIKWAKKYIKLLKLSIINFDSVGDIVWRDNLSGKLIDAGLTTEAFIKMIEHTQLKDLSQK